MALAFSADENSLEGYQVDANMVTQEDRENYYKPQDLLDPGSGSVASTRDRQSDLPCGDRRDCLVRSTHIARTSSIRLAGTSDMQPVSLNGRRHPSDKTPSESKKTWQSISMRCSYLIRISRLNAPHARDAPKPWHGTPAPGLLSFAGKANLVLANVCTRLALSTFRAYPTRHRHAWCFLPPFPLPHQSGRLV
ncbi:hypothetical protein SNOG_15375 [Parastagonospora nodorum SN15]|uniref:Uncharacterized protein n=1 Tax=Phaeosphaeria nodorum (strain SN15 / ATCC MYA-4574 / FGSC 10173) TaxID=321614 RepID=Q0TYV3_PHANO|nr:hypothetical protein SNOG_15375 [Parastagonospora nodorum SN15]EAT77308.1 hypothetical protein SNOG_15375 [Parastagonospora nodorum SN15]